MTEDSERKYRPRPNARKKSPADATSSVAMPPFTEADMPTDRIFVGDVLRTLRRLPSRCVDLVILDPPYWKVVNEEWDHQWRTEADYRAWCACWIAENFR